MWGQVRLVRSGSYACAREMGSDRLSGSAPAPRFPGATTISGPLASSAACACAREMGSDRLCQAPHPPRFQEPRRCGGGCLGRVSALDF